MYPLKDSILCMGFYCQVYKKNPNIRIFFNDKFIDDIDIEPFDIIEKKIPTLYFYHLKIPTSPLENNIRLEVKNSDSNYNNGFMTKSTLLQLFTFCLVPSSDYNKVYNTIKEQPNTHAVYVPFLNASNLTPHTIWQNEKGIVIENIIKTNIGGSGTFMCSFFKSFTFWKFKKPSIS